jgi:hypothetical protein
MKTIISHFLFFLISFHLIAQDSTITTKTLDKKPHYATVELKYHRDGFPSNGSNLDDFLTSAKANALEMRFGISTYGKRAWQKTWKFPTYGIGFYQTDWEATQYLGNPSAIFVFFNAPLIGAQKKFSFNYDIGIGVAYNFLAYDPETNPENDLIGSDVNVYLNFRGELNYELSNRLNADFGIGWTHFSNGRTRTPNIGVNMIGLDLGMKYHFRPSKKELYTSENFKPELLSPETGDFSPFWEYSSTVSGGWRTSSNDINSETIYRVGSLAFEANRHYGNIGKYGIGFDIFYDSGLVEEFPEGTSNSEFIYTGINFGHQLKIQKFTFITQLGVYLQDKPEKGKIYTRFALRYDIVKNLYIRGGLKTLNGFAADFIEWGVGYSIFGKGYTTQIQQFR